MQPTKERPRYYTLEADPVDLEVAVLTPHELTAGDAAKLPFNQPSGSQSSALGPVIKRTAPGGAMAAGPSPKFQKTTLDEFAKIGREGMTWSNYFAKAHDCWVRPKLRFQGQTIIAKTNAYQEAVERIEDRSSANRPAGLSHSGWTVARPGA